MATQLEILNQALHKVGTPATGAITSLSDTSPRGLLVLAEFPQALREVLRMHPWSFAKTRVQLSPNTTAPLFEWDVAFDLPSDLVRVVLYNGIDVWTFSDNFEIEGRMLLSDSTDCDLQYIAMPSPASSGEYPTSNFDPLFVNALSTYLAAKIAPGIREDGQQMALQLIERFERIDLPRATRINTNEMHLPRYDVISESRWLNYRRASTGSSSTTNVST